MFYILCPAGSIKIMSKTLDFANGKTIDTSDEDKKSNISEYV